jgi:uncharacterized repeat protein (TIGR01451 family)
VDGTDITYRAVLINDGWADLPAAVFTATFPAELTPGPASPELSSVGGNLVWSGPLPRNQPKVLTYTASMAASLPLGTTLRQVSWLAYPDHHILFDRVTEVRVNFPDLSHSTFSVTPAQRVEVGNVLNYTLVLRNDGLVDAPVVTTTNIIPPALQLLAIDPPSQGALISSSNSFTWTTSLPKNQSATLTYRAVISYQTSSGIKNSVTIDDSLSEPLTLTNQATFKVLPVYLPLIYRK